MESGFVLEEGTDMFMLTRALGISEEFFTRVKDFVPERQHPGAGLLFVVEDALPLPARCLTLRLVLDRNLHQRRSTLATS